MNFLAGEAKAANRKRESQIGSKQWKYYHTNKHENQQLKNIIS
jgi:hypothetical protein